MNRVVALAGGGGGARMADGLALAAGAENVTIIANTGDDMEHLGLHISPDVDSITYALADLENSVLGWGRRDETWSFMETLGALGGETWFRLGDRDLALHIRRSGMLADGLPLSEATARIARTFGIATQILPMSDDPVRTIVATDEGPLGLQHYFVRRRCEPRVSSLSFDGAERAAALPAALDALGDPALQAVIVCPSNPYISIDPILAVPGYRKQIARLRAPVVAVSPVIGGKAVKGPTVKIMAELGIEPSALAIAHHYHGLIDGLVIDTVDVALRPEIEAMGIAVLVTDAIMLDRQGRVRLAREALEFAAAI